jgi:lipoprotein-releasing system permease protein
MLLNPIRHLWQSPWTTWVGLRYLKSKQNSKFLSLITLLSILGVCVGVTAMIVVLSVMDGFEDSLKKRLMSSDLHILITPTAQTSGFDNGFVPKDTLEHTGILQILGAGSTVSKSVDAVWPMVSTEAIMKIGRKVSGVSLKGIDANRLERLKSQFSEIAEPQMLTEKQGPDVIHLPGIYVGQELAYEINLAPGDQVTMISPTETEGPLESVPRMKRFVIEAIYRGGTPEQELHTVYAADSSVRAFLRRADVVSQWEIKVKDFDQAPAIADRLRAAAPDLRVQDWVQLNSHLFASLRLERFAMSVALAFIIVVASFNIVTTLTLMVLEKRKEISILKAMGAEDGQVASIFLAEGLLIGSLGAFGGVLLAFVICCVLRRYDFVPLPDIYYDRTLPVTFRLSYYAGVTICAMVIVLAACLYPSRRAARLNPLDGIRFG